MSSKAFGNKAPLTPHIGGSPTKEVGDLRGDVEEAVMSLESKASYPQLNKVTGGAAVSLGAVPVAKAIAGSDFLQGQVKATLVKGTGTSALTFTANRPGTPGNSLSVEILTGGAESASVIGGTKISIVLNTSVSTANSVKATVDAVAAAAALVQVASGGAGIVAVAAETPLDGGVGLGLEVKVNGLEQTVAGAVSETAIPMVVSALTGAGAGDSVSVLVVSNGRQSNSMSVDVVA